MKTLRPKLIGKASSHNEVIISLIKEYNRATHVREGSLLRRKQKPKKTILGKLKDSQATFTSPLIKPAPYPCPAQLHEYYHSNSALNQTIIVAFAFIAIVVISLTLKTTS